MQYILYGMKHDGNPIIYGYDVDWITIEMQYSMQMGIQSYKVMMRNELEGNAT